MARIKIHSKWYEQVEPSTFFEQEFEDRVTLHAPSVYPFYHVLPFKKSLKTPDVNNKSGVSLVVPDLIFIAKDYSEWWIVEVEMGYHNFFGHVKPQVEKLLNADFGFDEVDYLCQKYESLDRVKLVNLVNNIPIRVLIIVNQNKPKWITHWTNKDIIFAIFELFRSDDEHEIFRVNGEYPSILMEKISDCAFHPIVPRLLRIKNPDNMGISRRGILRLLFNNCVTEWRRIDEGEDVWLTAINRNPLNSKQNYSIYRQNDGQLVLYQDS